MICRNDVYYYIKYAMNPKAIVMKYLGEPDIESSSNYIYYSPVRDRERTPSFYVNESKGIHDFGTDKHYSVISFVRDLFDISYWEATKKIIEDFDIDLTEIEENSSPIMEKIEQEEMDICLVKGNRPNCIYTYFDEKCFDEKPKKQKEIASIKRRIGLEENNFTKYENIKEITQEILKGKTCIPSAIKGNAKENWKKQQLFLVDFDNTREGEDICSNDCRHIDVKHILRYCEEIDLLPTFIYYTFSHTNNQHKFRLVYILEKPIDDYNVAKQIPKYLLEKLKKFNPDLSKKNLADMFFAGREIAYIGENYYKVEVKK